MYKGAADFNDYSKGAQTTRQQHTTYYLHFVLMLSTWPGEIVYNHLANRLILKIRDHIFQRSPNLGATEATPKS